ncbi:MAG TPA: ABC transporter substrate-binding protein, partial [Deinococcales bacterium]|nr:ABC transporter substrate-binding protein [Deinococcales bacterium]
MRLKLYGLLIALLLLPLTLAQEEGGTLRLGVIVPAAAAGPAGELARDARQGAEFAFEEFEFNAMLTELDLQVEIIEADDADTAVSAADELAADEDGLDGLAGGFDHDTALALSAWAEEHDVPFINLAAPTD